jgi:hypothetical protein
LKGLPLPFVRSLREAFFVVSNVPFDDEFRERFGRLLQQ